MRMVGYFWGSDPDSQINILEYSKYTHMIYCQLLVTSATDPTLIYGVGSSGGLSTVTTKVHAAGGKITICLIGGNYAEANPYPLTSIMANAGYRNTLASNLATFVTANSIDGVDIDWEGSDVVQANYNSFLSTLRTDLGGSKIISVTGAFEWLANEWFSTATITASVDFVNLMMYDIQPYPESSLLADVETYTQEWLTAGFSASQLNLGIPAFGYSAAGGIGDYYNIILNINPANNVNSTTATTPWTTTPNEYWWSGYDLNQAKLAYAVSKSLGGMMVYCANEDACGNAKSVISAIFTSQSTTVLIGSIPLGFIHGR